MTSLSAPGKPRRAARRLAPLLLVLAVAVVGGATAARAASPVNFGLANGWFYTETGGGDGAGYPVSGRWTDGAFAYQAFQKAVLQWQPGADMFYLNIYDRLHDVGQDGWLETSKNVPPPQDFLQGAGQSFAVRIQNHLALLDNNAAIKARWYANPDCLSAYGLPVAYQDRGALRVLRAQRAVFQQWMIPTTFTTVGGVVVANGGDHFKQANQIPVAATAAGPPYSQAGIAYFHEIASGAEFGSTSETIAKWERAITLEVRGSPTPSDTAALDQVVSELVNLLGPRITRVASSGNLVLHLAPLARFPALLPEYVPGNIGYVQIWWNGGSITRGVILIDSGQSEAIRSHIIREELTQALGLLRDAESYSGSIFHQHENTALTYLPIDEEVIRILHDSRVEPWMDAADLAQIGL
ncbi:MAG: DUF2927 domain-containing protein [Actinobacteria bacterium]|nr:DUF2927 domain-containing protein [Actinomycetota bacterium]